MSYASEGRQRSPLSPRDSSILPIPIPSHAHQNHSNPADRSPDSGRSLVSPSASRSPQPALSSYRNHPYPRRHSVSTQAALTHDDASRIYLPPPNSTAPLHVPHERRDPRDREQRGSPMDARDSRDSLWPDRRPSLPRAQSERYPHERGYQLPSFASITSASSSGGPVTPTSAPTPSGAMGPPAAVPNGSPGSSRATSPKPYSSFGGGGLRPSYSYEGPSGSSSAVSPASTARGHSLGLTIGGNGSGAPNSSFRSDPSPTRYTANDRTSPPAHPMNGYNHDQYMSPHNPHSYSSLHAAGRARSHSAASALSRYASSSDAGDWAGPQTPQVPVASGGGGGTTGGGGGGQNRRVAHLLSEQKRRESINTGFKALRATLPSSVPGDSKAIVLRKAVSHINHLEDLLRQAGIPITGATAAGGAQQPGVPPLPSLVRGDSGSVQDGDEEENEEEEDDVEMRDTTTGVATLKVGATALGKKLRSQGEWEHVENIKA